MCSPTCFSPASPCWAGGGPPHRPAPPPPPFRPRFWIAAPLPTPCHPPRRQPSPTTSASNLLSRNHPSSRNTDRLPLAPREHHHVAPLLVRPRPRRRRGAKTARTAPGRHLPHLQRPRRHRPARRRRRRLA